MKIPRIPHDEAERLEALYSYDVLDTGRESSFDALAKLAASVLDVPVAFVSFVDEKRQWFKAAHGLDILETSRDVSFCGHVVAEDLPIIVIDALLDSRFVDNPLVTGDPNIRFYAGIPLKTPAGFTLGTLCAIDFVPRRPTPKQLELLALLAGQVVNELDARQKGKLLAAERLAALDGIQQMEALFAAMEEGVVLQDRSGVITSANPSAERILGLTLDQMTGRTSTHPEWRCIHEDGSPFPGSEHPAMVTLRTGDACRNVVMGVHVPNAGVTWIRMNSVPLQYDMTGAPRSVVVTFHDITLIKAAQATAERLSHQERLVTTGTLAAGVGHEINNPLAYVLANLEFCIEQMRTLATAFPSGRASEILLTLGEAREGAERIRKIVSGLRSLAREESAPIPTDIVGIIETSLNIAAHEIRHRATVVRHLGPAPLVMADDSRLTQVLVNLLVNAAQAFSTTDVARNHIVIESSVDPEGLVVLAISDNGSGIHPDHQSRIFDPFFTTKPTGRGTGLGLSICESIVTSLGGELSMTSTLGEGTTFRVSLPAAEPSPSPMAVAPSLRSEGPRGRVLVIDDEPAIVKIVERLLGCEHEVVGLVDSREALERLCSGEWFDVVFCDITMPYLSGDALHQEVARTHPDVARRFVFITGGAIDPRVQRFLAETPNERLDKPFESRQLRAIARRFTKSPT